MTVEEDHTFYIVANWKQYGTIELLSEFFLELQAELSQAQDSSTQYGACESHQSQVVLCPPTIYLMTAKSMVVGHNLTLGAQALSATTGANHTGETSAEMLKDVGARFAIVGHSEQRKLYGYTTAQLVQQINGALAQQVMPIICLGETQQDYDDGNTFEVLARQLSVFGSVSCGDLLLAYEPVWAIGTGVTPSEERVREVFAFITEHMTQHYHRSVPVLYGGSVTRDNAASLRKAVPQLRGFIVGGASRDAKHLVDIMKECGSFS